MEKLLTDKQKRTIARKIGTKAFKKLHHNYNAEVHKILQQQESIALNDLLDIFVITMSSFDLAAYEMFAEGIKIHQLYNIPFKKLIDLHLAQVRQLCTEKYPSTTTIN